MFAMNLTTKTIVHWLETYTPMSTPKNIVPVTPEVTYRLIALKERQPEAIDYWAHEVANTIFEDGWDDHVIVVAPSSNAGPARNGMYNLAKRLNSFGFTTNTDALVRTREVPKSYRCGDRSDARHESTIVLSEEALFGLRDKHILLLDDILTTGSTLVACCNILEQAKPTSITALCLGKTLRWSTLRSGVAR